MSIFDNPILCNDCMKEITITHQWPDPTQSIIAELESHGWEVVPGGIYCPDCFEDLMYGYGANEESEERDV